MTTTADSIFYGSHRNGCVPRYEAERINRQRVTDRCASVVVTADDIASCIDENGVDEYKCGQLIRKLIVRAHDEAVRKTLGL